MRIFIGIGLIVLALSIALAVLYKNSQYSHTTRSFSDYTLLTSSWEKYKKQFINQDGRVIDYTQGDITTSEGQSYAMLRAVWVDDKETFDRVWKWTSENLKRPNDKLFAWRWGKKDDGGYGAMKDGGDNSASDADQDIALALLYASSRWNDAKYREQAEPIIKDIWKIEVAKAGEKNYLAAGSWAIAQNEIMINPSYFAPYAWRAFAKVDKDNDWNSLIDPAYELLTRSSQEKLDKEKSVGLPPDWITVKRSDGSLGSPNVASFVDTSHLTTNYGYDAVRVPWRIAADYAFYQEPKAQQYLQSMKFLSEAYQQNQKILGSYAHDGTPTVDVESPVMYSTALAALDVTSPDIGNKMFQDKILRLYSNDQSMFNDQLPYYEQNWLWFGAALHSKFLTPLYK